MTEAIYHVVPQKNNLFTVEMTPSNGRLRLIPDFRDKADADGLDRADRADAAWA
jgi:hypothetical protein